MKNYFFKILFALSIFLVNTSFAAVMLEVSPNKPSMNDNISLTFTYSGQHQPRPNFDLLSKDFIITRTSQSNQISVYNGVVDRQNKWRLLLTPKHAGQLTIPEITFADEKSPQRIIQISKATHKTHLNNDKPIFMMASTSSKAPYVQQQFIYTIKLFFRVTPIANETIPPSVDNAVLSPIGDGENYTTEIKGIPYHVLEQRYAVFAEKPGNITIHSPIMNATLRGSNVHDISQLMNDFQDVKRISAPDTTLNIQPIPTAFTGQTWLPSEALTLTESWPDKKANLKAGEPITREITMQATGLMGNQLPELSFENIPGANVYPEPSKKSDRFSKGQTIGTKTFKVTYIPTGEQNIKLPSIQINWWNLKIKQEQTASLNTINFEIEKSISSNVEKQPKPEIVATPPVKVKKHLPPQSNKPLKQSKKYSIKTDVILPWLLVGILVLMLMISVFKNTKSKKSITSDDKQNKASLNKLHKQLKKACMNNQAQQAAQNLIALMNQQNPNQTIRSLLDIQKIANEHLVEELELLQNRLYGNSQNWLGKAFWQAYMEQKNVKNNKRNKNEALPSFN